MASERAYNAADPKHVKSRKDRDKVEELRRQDALDYVMSDPRGREFVWYLLSETKLYEDSFTGNSATFYNEGRRSVGLKLIATLEAAKPVEFIQMWNEHLVTQKQVVEADSAARTEASDHKTGEEF